MARPPGKLYRGAMTVLASFKARAAELKREVLAIYLAAKHPRTPWYAKALLVAIVAYVLSPIDLIPDFIPVLGLLDDAIIVPLGIALAVRLTPAPLWQQILREAEASPLRLPRSWWGLALIAAIWVTLLALIVWALWRWGAGR